MDELLGSPEPFIPSFEAVLVEPKKTVEEASPGSFIGFEAVLDERAQVVGDEIDSEAKEQEFIRMMKELRLATKEQDFMKLLQEAADKAGYVLEVKPKAAPTEPMSMPLGDAVAIFKAIDANNDGIISADEFASAYEKGMFSQEQERKRAEEDAKRRSQELEKVAANLKDELPNAFQRDLDWDIFSDDVTVVDQRNSKLNGKLRLKRFVSTIRSMYQELKVQQDVQVHFIDGEGFAR
jgi:Ca2+-binding EF-hand superfamily protein